MQILYKLTDENMQTHNGFQWRLGRPSRRIPGNNDTLCSPAVYHAYLSPELAVLLTPIHANFRAPRLFEARGNIVVRDGALKVGVKQLTLTHELSIPVVTTAQRVKFAILCAKAVYADSAFQQWADAWLAGADRTIGAAEAARAAAWAAAARRDASFDLAALARLALAED